MNSTLTPPTSPTVGESTNHGGFGRDETALAQIYASTAKPRPLLLTGGTVITGTAVLGDWKAADVLIVDDKIVGVGPGLLADAANDGTILIDCAGTMILPSVVDSTGETEAATITPGSTANIAVVRLEDQMNVPPSATGNRGEHLDILITNGVIKVWNAKTLDTAGNPPELKNL